MPNRNNGSSDGHNASGNNRHRYANKDASGRAVSSRSSESSNSNSKIKQRASNVRYAHNIHAANIRDNSTKSNYSRSKYCKNIDVSDDSVFDNMFSESNKTSGKSETAVRNTNNSRGGACRNIPNNKERRNVQKKRTKKKRMGKGKKVGYAFLCLFLVGLLAAGVALALVVNIAYKASPITEEMLDVEAVQATKFYNSRGKLIESIEGSSEVDRVFVKGEKIPKHLKDAVVAIEDERFYDHNGFDVIALGRAVTKKIFSPNSAMEGGSTLTMQLVKNITGKSERTASRKIQEQYLAMNIEKRLSKDEILEKYLNIVHFGSNVYGVQSASRAFFNKNVQDLTIAESACIAAVLKGSTYYSPIISDEGKKHNLERQKIVLQSMLKNEFITQKEYDKACNEKIKFHDRSLNIKGEAIRSYFVDYAAAEVRNDLIKTGYTEESATSMVYGGGLKIYLTLDSKIQKKMNKVYRNPAYFYLTSGSGAKAQSGMVILDSHTSEIRAMYGGRGKKDKNMILNRATGIERQPGSSIKPIAVYGPAIDTKTVTAATLVKDERVYLNSASSSPYPTNADGTYRGNITITDAVRLSVNVVAAKVYLMMDPSVPLDYLSRVNIDRDQKNVALAMGGLNQGVSPLQMAAAYVPFSNNGMYNTPTSYTKVVDRYGEVILDKSSTDGIKTESQYVYDAKSAYIMTHIMKQVRYGTAGSYAIVKGDYIETAGKTGTTENSKDKWFVGFTPYYTAAVWYGFDNPYPVYDGSSALKVWNAVMKEVHADLEEKQFDKPNGLSMQTACRYTGEKPISGCSTVTTYFLPGTKPDDLGVCDGNHATGGSSESNKKEKKKASSYDPADSNYNDENNAKKPGTAKPKKEPGSGDKDDNPNLDHRPDYNPGTDGSENNQQSVGSGADDEGGSEHVGSDVSEESEDYPNAGYDPAA